MNELAQGRQVRLGILVGSLALSTLFAYHVHPQKASTQTNGSAPVQCADNQLTLRFEDEVIGMRAIRFMKASKGLSG